MICFVLTVSCLACTFQPKLSVLFIAVLGLDESKKKWIMGNFKIVREIVEERKV